MKFRLAFREVSHNRRFSLAYIFNFGLGILGFLLLNSLNSSVQENFQSRSQALLTADLAVSSRRPITPEEEKTIDHATLEASASTRTIELYSMIATPQSSRLIEIVAIEDKYPLYGELNLEKKGQIRGDSPKSIQKFTHIWISPELSVQLGLSTGQTAKIGSISFLIEDRVQQDAGASWRGFSLAPRVYMGLEQLKGTGLIKPGSTLSYRRFFKFHTEKQLQEANLLLQRNLTDPGIQITTHQRAGEQMGRTMAYLSDYLSLVSLVGLFLAVLGGTYLFYSFLSRRMGEIATLLCLGLSHYQAIQTYLIQILLLGSASVITAGVGTSILLPLLENALLKLIAFPFHLHFSWLAFFSALTIVLGSSVLTCLPLILKIRSLKPSLLFQESQTQTFSWNIKSLKLFIPAFLFFFLLSVWQAHSWKIGGLFFGGITASSLLLAGLVGFGLKILARLKNTRPLPFKLATRYLTHTPLSTIAVFLAVGLAATLMNLLPQIQRNIQAELASPETSRIPSLFLFDIQEEQLDTFKKLIEDEKIGIMQTAPLVRARLESINGQAFQKNSQESSLSTREEEQETRMRNRGFNLTSRESFSDAETIVSGKAYSGPYTGNLEKALQTGTNVPEISVETHFAKTLGVHLGDLLVFDIQGVRVPGRITSLRKVKWTSFQPNFLIQFQAGVLEDAPKTYLATLAKLSLADRARIQNKIVQNLPNISMVDVTSVVERLLSFFDQTSIALQVMALLSFITGLVVLFSIARHQAQTRSPEIQLLKVLGGSENFISKTHWIEFGGMGFFASLLGVSVSVGFSWIVSVYLFDSAWSFSWILPFYTTTGITSLTLLVTTLAIRKTVLAKPTSLLN